MMGEGVKQDIDEAIKWYKRAADQGDHIAQVILETFSSPSSEMKDLESPTPSSLEMEDSEDSMSDQMIMLLILE